VKTDRYEKLKCALAGSFVGLAVLAILLVAWGWVGFATRVWVDGCPDVVAAYACPKWWEDIFLFVLPPTLFAVSICSGFLAQRSMFGWPNHSFEADGSAAAQLKR
jgi:hypothetical protein